MKKPVLGRPIVVQIMSRYISIEIFNKICDLVPQRRIKYKLIFKMCRFMMRRPCEVCAVQIQDINFQTHTIRMMMGKTNIISDIPVPDGLWVELIDYIELNKHTFINGFVFPAMTSSADHIQTDTASRYFRQLMDVVGVSARIPGKQSHSRLCRFYDVVSSGTTDLTKISDPLQGRIARRHTDDRAIKHYQDIKQLSRERELFNQIYDSANLKK